MKKDVVNTKFNSSFLSCENDIEIILKKLFVESSYSNILKRLLVINTKDCLDIDVSESKTVEEVLKNTNLRTLIRDQYIKLSPRIKMPEHEEVKSYIIISMDNYTMNATNPQFRDCTVTFDIICNLDAWELGNYRIRPLKIAGYIDGILNETHLTGIGTFNFIGCNELLLNEDLAGYTLSYRAVHGSDDRILRDE